MRDRLVASMAARLRLVGARGDLRIVLEPKALVEAERLAEIVPADVVDVDVNRVLGWFYWFRYIALAEREMVDAARRAFTPCFIAGVTELPTAVLALLAEDAIPTASAWTEHASASTEVAPVSTTIALWQRILAALPADHPQRAEFLYNLGHVRYLRFERTSEIGDLHEAIGAARSAMSSARPNDPDRGAYLTMLGNALLTRFKQTFDRTDLDEAITTSQRVASAMPANDRNRFRCLGNLAAAHLARFAHDGSRSDLDEAIAMGRVAMTAAPKCGAERALGLTYLSAALRTRFDHTGALTDLDEAVTVAREAIEACPTGEPSRASSHTLGTALLTRFDRLGDQADLDDAIATERKAVHNAPAGLPDRAAMLSLLSIALVMRSGRTGAVADLDEAISTSRAVVAVVPADRVARSKDLNNLSVTLRTRFEHLGALADLDQSISVARDALDAVPLDHADRAAVLSTLGAALEARFHRTGSVEDVDEAVTAGRQAVHAARADHPKQAHDLIVLSRCLTARFVRTGDVADLGEAVAAARQAVQIVPADHPLRVWSLTNLGQTLRTQAGLTGREPDLDEAIEVSRAAVRATPTSSADHVWRLVSLADTVRARGTARDEAISLYLRAAALESGTPSVRVHAVREAVSLAPGDAADLAQPLETAVRLFPAVASRRLDRGDQQHFLGQLVGVASDAAGAALARGRGTTDEEPAVRALRLLELGRGVMVSAALDTRSDITDLGSRHPALAERFIELRDELDHTDAGPSTAKDRHQLAAAFSATVARIRDLDDFETFLLPPEPAQLVRHAEHGPIVVINVSRYRSDAIVLRPQGITAIPLPNLGRTVVIDRATSFRRALHAAHDSVASPDQRRRAEDALGKILGWLWDAAAEPVLDQLGYHHPPELGATWPRLWWVAGGIMGLLPMHAAGHHGEPTRPTVLDRVISSYTPTVRALGYARERDLASNVTERALIVSMPDTPGGHSPLRYAGVEAELVRGRLSQATLLTESSADSAALPTKAAVLTQLRDCAIAHFACHGTSDPVDPSRSRLLLHDHDTAPLTVASLTALRLDHARLAYLSACHTAVNAAPELADEAIHLTTAFQLAGYPHVIGTLWQIQDALAARIADSFYAALTTSNIVNTSNAAAALHHTVRAAREKQPTTPSLWAAYLHSGA